MDDRIMRGWWAGRSARWMYVEADAVVRAAARAHGLTPGTLAFLGELIGANALLGAWVKGEDRATLQVAGQKPSFTYHGEIDADGAIRARFTPRHVMPPHGLMTAQLLGIRSSAVAEVYRGSSAVTDESVELAVEAHLRLSDQVDVAVRLLTQHEAAEPGLTGAWAGVRALMIERMPEEPGRPTVEGDDWKALRLSLTDDDLHDFVAAARVGEWRGADVEILEERPLIWRCRCSEERVRDMLLGLGGAALKEMAAEDHGAEVTCHFCNQARHVSEADLLRLAAQADAPLDG
jgi:molecular chaperone Hsp33